MRPGAGHLGSVIAAGAMLALGSVAQAADLGAEPPPAPDPFVPARPVGVASELPRSPLADVTVFGTERFGSPAEAQARCRRDVVVRVEAPSPAYHAVGTPGVGAFMCRSSALSEGDLPR